MAIACTPGKSSSESAAASSAAPASSVAALASGAASVAAPAPAIELWSGTYASTVGSFYVFDGGEWAGVQWRGDEAAAGLGEGTMSISVDRATGAVRGVLGGAIGEATLSGSASGDTVTASVSRKDPLDRGLTGTAVAKTSGDNMVGTMRLSVANARVIREASFTLSRGKP
jgi:hypothetical protein